LGIEELKVLNWLLIICVSILLGLQVASIKKESRVKKQVEQEWQQKHESAH